VKMSNIVSRRDGFVSDIKKMIANGSSNDVKIVLRDWEMMANKDIISARCEYFATMFSNKEVKFIEGETNIVDIRTCCKAVMKTIVDFLFIGDVELHDLSLGHLLELMQMTKMMLLEDLFADTQKFVLGFLPDSGVNCGSIPELVEGLIFAEQFKLETIKDALLLELFLSLEDIPHIPEVVKNSEAIKDLSANLLKAIILHEGITVGDSKQRLDAFVFWLSENECSEEDKKEITDSFKFEEFTADELLTDVRKSGLYSIKKIDTRLQYILNSQVKNLNDNHLRFRTLKSYYIVEKKKTEQKEKIIGQMKSALNNERAKTAHLEHTLKLKDVDIEHEKRMRKCNDNHIDFLKSRISDKDQTIAEYEEDIADKDSMISSQEAEITQLESEISEKNGAISRLEMNKISLDTDIVEKHLDILDLQRENDEMRATICDLKVRNRGKWRGRGRGNRNFSHKY